VPWEVPVGVRRDGLRRPEPLRGVRPGGGTPSFTWTRPAPPGVTLSSAGVFGGTPTFAGSYNFTVVATMGGCTGSKNYTINVEPPAPARRSRSIRPPRSRAASRRRTTPCSSPPRAASRPTPFAVTGGTLPPGLTLNAEGYLFGRPTLAGTFTSTSPPRTARAASPASTAYQITIDLRRGPSSLRRRCPTPRRAPSTGSRSPPPGGVPPYLYTARGRDLLRA